MNKQELLSLLRESLDLLEVVKDDLPIDHQEKLKSIKDQIKVLDRKEEEKISLADQNPVDGGLEWWGYEHRIGTIHVKRYFNEDDIEEARESPFVRRVVPMFLAKTRNEALRYVIKYTGHICLYSKQNDPTHPKVCKRCGNLEELIKTNS